MGSIKEKGCRRYKHMNKAYDLTFTCGINVQSLAEDIYSYDDTLKTMF